MSYWNMRRNAPDMMQAGRSIADAIAARRARRQEQPATDELPAEEPAGGTSAVDTKATLAEVMARRPQMAQPGPLSQFAATRGAPGMMGMGQQVAAPGSAAPTGMPPQMAMPQAGAMPGGAQMPTMGGAPMGGPQMGGQMSAPQQAVSPMQQMLGNRAVPPSRPGPAPQMAPGPQMGPRQMAAPQAPGAPQGPGRLAARRQELMAQGMSAQEAVEQMGRDGTIDPRLAEMMLRVPRAAGGAGF